MQVTSNSVCSTGGSVTVTDGQESFAFIPIGRQASVALCAATTSQGIFRYFKPAARAAAAFWGQG